ncbi:VOC family protein [Butyricimonas virosa]
MFPSLLSYTGEFNIVIDCNNAGVLAEFYSKLLGWEWTRPRANG